MKTAIYSINLYCDTLLSLLMHWNETILIGHFNQSATSLTEALEKGTSDGRTRAKEMYRIGLFTHELTKGDKALNLIKKGENLQSSLGFVTSLIYRQYNNANPKLHAAFGAINAIFSIVQSVLIGDVSISINTLIFKLLKKFPCPEDISSIKWLRFALSGFFCEINHGDEVVLQSIKAFLKGESNNLCLRIIHPINKEGSYNIRGQFSNSDELRKVITDNVSLNDIYQQKRPLFIMGLPTDDRPRGFYGFASKLYPEFLRVCAEIEQGHETDSPFKPLYIDDESPESQKGNALEFLANFCNYNDKFKLSFSEIMKTIETGAIEALSQLTNKPIDFFYKKLGKSSEDTEFILKLLSAIRTKPFILLAGISGTGKSRIVRKLAQATVSKELQGKYDPESIKTGFNRWNLHKPANFELIQVKPNWHSSMEVIGYKSNIGGSHYEFTPFIEFVARAWQHQDLPFFLCLDEMNLAPVEQYFAEYLSAIESQTKEDGKYITDPIIKPFESFGKELCDQMLDKLLPKVPASAMGTPSAEEIESLKTHFKTKGLTLPRNLIVMGTVNMDETTFTFSRKVLDRAMSIVMNEVKIDDFFEGKTENDVTVLSPDRIKSLIDRPLKGIEAPNNSSKEVKEYLIEIDKVLDKTPFKLGYRALNEALLYVSAADMLDIDYATALDQFTLMKILSRIEGDKRSIGDLLEKLKNVISGKESCKKLELMVDTLNSSQFVSYWT